MDENTPFLDARTDRLEAVANAARTLASAETGQADLSERLARLRAAVKHLDALPKERKP